MPSLLVIVLVLNIITALVNTVGASTIDSLLWLLYIRLPIPTRQTASEQRRLKREVLELKREMNATSSQDEFAKWAKLRRRHDKAMEEYDAKNKALVQDKGSFDFAVKVVRWTSTTGLKFALQFWYSKSPIFALPPGWFPWQVEWVLSFPRAPLGTVSIGVWGGACAAVISLIEEAIRYVMAYVSGIQKPQKAKPAKVGTNSGSEKQGQAPSKKTE